MILVIDDDPVIRQLVQGLLCSVGYEVETAVTAEEALLMMGTGLKPDLVILDMILPRMNGNDFLEELVERGDDVPVILLSAYLHELKEEVADRACAAIHKPLHADELLSVVGHICPLKKVET